MRHEHPSRPGIPSFARSRPGLQVVEGVPRLFMFCMLLACVSVPGAQQAAVARRLHGLVLDTRADGSFELPRAGRVPDGTIPHESTSCETGRASSSCYEELTLSVPSVATSISAVAKGCRSGCKARTVQPSSSLTSSSSYEVARLVPLPARLFASAASWTQSSWLYCSWVRRVARCRQ